VDQRTIQLTKQLDVVDTSKEFRTYVASFQVVYDLRTLVTRSLVIVLQLMHIELFIYTVEHF
jgi:hypothetical protein